MDDREEARKYFKKCNLTYKDIGLNELYKLIKMLNKKIAEVDSCMIMINVPKPKDIILKNDELVFAAIKVKGTYFEDREAITFNKDGFIGFCGWADGHNTKPFVDGFKEWCNYLKI